MDQTDSSKNTDGLRSKFLAVSGGLAALLVGSAFFYHYVVYLPQNEAQKQNAVLQEQAAESKAAADNKQLLTQCEAAAEQKFQLALKPIIDATAACVTQDCFKMTDVAHQNALTEKQNDYDNCFKQYPQK
jgi:hypothetical protein